MKVAFLVRVPRGYSFRGDRISRLVQQRGHEVVGIVVERLPPGKFIRDLSRKFGPSMFLRKTLRVVSRWTGSPEGVPTPGERSDRTDGSAETPTPRVYVVKSHNSPECAELLKSLVPDVLFLRGCGIIRAEILKIPKLGVLNAHYGELPKYRGVYATEWAVLHGDHPVITMHFVDGGIDTGTILASRPVPLKPGATLASLRDDSSRVGADLLIDVLDDLQNGTLSPREQSPEEGLQYFTMHPRIRAVAERRLQQLVTQ